MRKIFLFCLFLLVSYTGCAMSEEDQAERQIQRAVRCSAKDFKVKQLVQGSYGGSTTYAVQCNNDRYVCRREGTYPINIFPKVKCLDSEVYWQNYRKEQKKVSGQNF